MSKEINLLIGCLITMSCNDLVVKVVNAIKVFDSGCDRMVALGSLDTRLRNVANL